MRLPPIVAYWPWFAVFLLVVVIGNRLFIRVIKWRPTLVEQYLDGPRQTAYGMVAFGVMLTAFMAYMVLSGQSDWRLVVLYCMAIFALVASCRVSTYCTAELAVVALIAFYEHGSTITDEEFAQKMWRELNRKRRRSERVARRRGYDLDQLLTVLGTR